MMQGEMSHALGCWGVGGGDREINLEEKERRWRSDRGDRETKSNGTRKKSQYKKREKESLSAMTLMYAIIPKSHFC